MNNEFESEQYNPLISDEEDNGRPLPRWATALVVGVAATSFITLAWYAYHAGNRAAQEGNLMVVEAEPSPVKQKPLNPGGMQFPNQDKSVFNVLSEENAKTTGEQLAPATEAPLPSAPTGANANWVNEKLQDTAQVTKAAKKEALVGNVAEKNAKLAPASGDTEDDAPSMAELFDAQNKKNATTTPAVPASAASAPATPATQPAPMVIQPAQIPPSESPSETVKTITKTIKKETPAPKVVNVTPPKGPSIAAAPAVSSLSSPSVSSAAGSLIQLGAYRSQGEAEKAWKKISKKHAMLAGLEPTIVRADLGKKGIYYRLRTAVESPKVACAQLGVEKQPCIVVN